ncbi:hypothetical protein TNCV_738041 [Trichonephila clavipes]|nr:hypothetical protein TNCV_738041 [Trichonephila clavipes]
MTEAESSKQAVVSIKYRRSGSTNLEDMVLSDPKRSSGFAVTSRRRCSSHLVAQLEPRVLEDIWDIVKKIFLTPTNIQLRERLLEDITKAKQK